MHGCARRCGDENSRRYSPGARRRHRRLPNGAGPPGGPAPSTGHGELCRRCRQSLRLTVASPAADGGRTLRDTRSPPHPSPGSPPGGAGLSGSSARSAAAGSWSPPPARGEEERVCVRTDVRTCTATTDANWKGGWQSVYRLPSDRAPVEGRQAPGACLPWWPR